MSQCQHGVFLAALTLKSMYIFCAVRYKVFPYLYTFILTVVKIGKTRNWVSAQFLVFSISIPVKVTVYQHAGSILYFLNITSYNKL